MSLIINSSGKQRILRLPQLSLSPLRLMPLTQTQWSWKTLSRNSKDVPLIPVLQEIAKESESLCKELRIRIHDFSLHCLWEKNKMTRYFGTISMTESICVSALLRNAKCLISEHVMLWNLFFLFSTFLVFINCQYLRFSLILFLLISFLNPVSKKQKKFPFYIFVFMSPWGNLKKIYVYYLLMVFKIYI